MIHVAIHEQIWLSRVAEKRRTMRPRIATIVELLKAEPDTGFAAIAARVGLTRERIRQIAKKYIGETGKNRKPTRKRPTENFTKRSFAMAMKQHLFDCGYGYCSCCLTHNREPVIDGEGMTKVKYRLPYRCKKCVSEYYRKKRSEG